MPGVQTSFEPDAGASDEVYTYGVTVGDAETLNDLNVVTVCLYHSLNENGLLLGEGDGTCTLTNAQNTAKLTWTRSTGAFAITAGTSTYWALGTGADASSAPADLTATSGTLAFRFRVSEAMREGTWTAKATATDINAGSATDLLPPTKGVSAYSSVTTRVQQSFGALGTIIGGISTTSPTVISNGATTLSLTAGDFTDGTYSFSLKTDGFILGSLLAAPAAGQVTYDCNMGSLFVSLTAVRVGTSATSLGTATSTGTAEGGTAVSNACQIKHGGERPASTYSGTIVNAVHNA